MKRSLSILLLFSVGYWAYAQKPDWTDFYKRQERFPSEQFLTGFVSGENTQQQASGDLLDKYEELARLKLVQSIQVSVMSISSMQIENLNQQSKEALTNKSVSLAKADITGLHFERFYDQKRDEAYALAWARKSELLDFYQQKIDKNLIIIREKKGGGDQLAQASNRNDALKMYSECMPLFSQLEEAQSLLIALGQTADQVLQLHASGTLKLAVKSALADLLNSNPKNLGEVAYAMAYGLFLQAGSLAKPCRLEPFTYEETGLSSALSDQLNSRFEKQLVEVGQYQLTQQSAELVVDGTFWKEGSEIRFIANMREKGQTLASVESRFPLAQLEAEKIAYVPSNFYYIQLIDQTELTAQPTTMQVKRNRQPAKPIRITAVYQDPSGRKIPLADAPVKLLAMPSGQVMGRTVTDNNGVGSCYLPAINSDKKMIILKAQLDVAQFARLDTNHFFYQKVEHMYPAPEAKVILKVSGLSIYLSAQESAFGKGLQNHLIEPRIKEVLTAKGFVFTTEMDQADLMMEIQAQGRKGNVFQGMYFSFVDGSVSVTDMQTGEEVHKSAFSSIKGGGSNWEHAKANAFVKAARTISEQLPAGSFN